MQWRQQFREHLNLAHRPFVGAFNALRMLGPGLLVTVGFIDPGNWASNVAAGAGFGYTLLWVVTLGTLMLILLQHNAAHLGIVTGRCLSESATRHLPAWLSRPALFSAVAAAIATAFAEILGGAIALQMLFHLPLKLGACITAVVVAGLLLWNSYGRIEKLIMGFVSIIGIAFVFELCLVHVHWGQAASGWVTPALPPNSMLVVMSVLGAVVMPHNLFLHSEIIQSRQWNLQGDEAIRTHLRFEFLDTLFSMIIGWVINSAMILLAAATFFHNQIPVDSLEQAQEMLHPIVGPAAAVVFALALLCAGIASSITAGMAGGTIFAGLFDEPYEITDNHTRAGIGITIGVALAAVFLVTDSFKSLVISQMLLSIQLPITIVLQVWLTSSRKVMGAYANQGIERILLWTVTAIVIVLNLLLLRSALVAQ
jgi:manganese transport protein